MVNNLTTTSNVKRPILIKLANQPLTKDVDHGLIILIMFIDQTSSKNINPLIYFNQYCNDYDYFASKRSHIVCFSLSPAKDYVFFSHFTVTL